MPGPKSLPANVHRIRGNPSKKPAAVLDGGLHPAVEIPECPVTLLSVDAIYEWNRVTVELARLRVVSEIDLAMLAVYCQAWGDWCQAQRYLRSTGAAGYVTVTPSGYEQQSVWLQISNRAAETMKSVGALFGMNPSARTGVQPSQGPQMDMFDGKEETGEGAGKYF